MNFEQYSQNLKKNTCINFLSRYHACMIPKMCMHVRYKIPNICCLNLGRYVSTNFEMNVFFKHPTLSVIILVMTPCIYVSYHGIWVSLLLSAGWEWKLLRWLTQTFNVSCSPTIRESTCISHCHLHQHSSYDITERKLHKYFHMCTVNMIVRTCYITECLLLVVCSMTWWL